MRAWTFIILRNLFLSQMRRARFKGEWDDITASKILAAPASQDRHIELGDMQRALMHLPQPQREALILVGAGGFAYEEAAEICGCAVGTIKSRVARGRVALEQLLSSGKLPSRRQHKTDPDKSALQTIMGEVDELSRDHEWARIWLRRAPSVQAAQQIREIAVARLRRRGLEGAAERGRNAGMRGRNVHSDDLSIHAVQFRCRNVFAFQLHHSSRKRAKAPGSFVIFGNLRTLISAK